jgi:uncharacterized protein (DUF1778 family)
MASSCAGARLCVVPASDGSVVLRAATEAAADVLADRRAFLLDEDAWHDALAAGSVAPADASHG